MKILYIDTTTSYLYGALWDENKVVESVSTKLDKDLSVFTLQKIKEMFEKANLGPSSIDKIIVVNGPGSFTGIRIGVATIKPIAEVLNIKVASCTSLEVLAKNVENEEIIVSLIDSRNNQVYCGIFDKEYNKKEEYIADDINNVIEVLKKYKSLVCVGNGAILHKDLLVKNLENVKFCDKNEQLAANCGKVGYKKFLENNLLNSDTIIPIYLRKSQAERLKK